MDNDIVPHLLAVIERDFFNSSIHSDKLKRCLKRLKNKEATYIDAHDFAIEIGKLSSESLQKNISSKDLPNGKMYFNIADRILSDTMEKNYALISSYSSDIQTLLNYEANLRIRGQIPDINQDNIDSIIDRISSEPFYDDVNWLLKEPIIYFSQSIVDDTIKKNVELHSKVGLSPKIIRTLVGKPCDWCKNLAGSYDYYDAPSDIYKRHNRCRCTLDYKPIDGRVQNVWSKAWK